MPRRLPSRPRATVKHRAYLSLFAIIEPLESRKLLSGDSTLPVLIGGAAARSVQFTDPNGTHAIIQLVGGGNATVTFDGNNLAQSASPNGISVSGTSITIDSIATTGTNLNSILQISTRGVSGITVGTITADGVLHSINAGGVTVTGNLTTAGWVKEIALGGAEDGTISIGPSHINGGLTFHLGSATDESLTSDVRIDSLIAGQWINSATTSQTVTAPQIMAMSIRGGFAPSLTVSGIPGATSVLKSFAAGSIESGTWNITGNVGNLAAGSIALGWIADVDGGINSISVSHDASMNLTALTVGNVVVRGSLSDSIIALNQPLAAVGFDLKSLIVGGGIVSTSLKSIGSIHSVSAADMEDSQIYAGLINLPDGQGLPQQPTDFANVARIDSVTIRHSANSATYIASDVAAYALGAIAIGTVQMSNSGMQFGVGAHTLKSMSLTDLTTGKSVHENNVSNTAQFSSLMVSKGITPKDFLVNLV